VLGNVDTAISGVDLRGTLKDASLALRSFKETADKLNKLLDGKNIQIANILNNVEQVTEGLRGLNPKIDTILLDLNKTSKDLNKVEFDQLANSIKILSKELFKTTKAINNKDGSLGMLVYDDSLYVNLNSTVNQLNNLLKDIEKYPRRYTGVTERQRRKGNKLKEK
jgi:phospholipid/cholesterol/gamma-HCH transport system substrate-binding protein